MELTWFPPSNAANQPTAGTDVEILPGMTLSGQAPGFGQQGGFNDNPVYVVVTIGEDGNIASLTVDTSSESEGIGTQCSTPDFTDRFIGKPARNLALGTDVDAMTGATVTSAAVVEAINRAVPVTDGAGALTPHTLNFTVVGILETGGEEEEYIYMSLDDMAAMTGQAILLVAMYTGLLTRFLGWAVGGAWTAVSGAILRLLSLVGLF